MAPRFTREELQAQRGRTVPDLIGDDCKLLFVGINPGLWTAATQTHFCHPSNRFYPALRKAGLIDWEVDTSTGLTEEQKSDLISSGIGITNLVKRATARASELSPRELRDGVPRLARFVERWVPRVVAVAGITAFRTAFSQPAASLGVQPEVVGSAELWVVPNPSGLNAHETVGSLAEWYRSAADAAGL
ncbi:MAG: mismatch-specific DNA-glycosylase [Acidimicrobiia bacterium]|nr:mismatch-specific DNA-glycosylase [Acidimicrobiia bacterium]